MLIRDMCVAATNVRRIADMHPQGGAAMNDRTCRAYIQAGVAAFHIEDQVQAKRCGALASKQFASEAGFLTRIKAAVNAREDLHSDIVIIARSDCADTYGLATAIDRVRKALSLGADVGFLEGLQTEDDARQVIAALAPHPVYDG